jgi:transposase
MEHLISAKTKNINVLPMVKHYITELGIYELFQRYIPKRSNAFIEPSQALCMMIINIICSSQPLYKVEEWLTDYMDGMAENGTTAAQYNDDQLGRSLDKLFKVDRSSLMAEISANAIKTYGLETSDIHNDSTSVSFTGAYNEQPEKTVQITRGFNKDHRPDCKQIVFGLNITADGNVPISYLLFDGNRTDDTTHVPNWEGLRELLEKEDFIYIADCKLCSMKNLGHIHSNGGIFITIIPKNRKCVKTFYEHIQDNDIDWQDTLVKEDTRKKGKLVTYRTFEQDFEDTEYRLIWVHSSSKQEQDRKRRNNVLKKALEELDTLTGKLNKYNLKTKDQIENAIKKSCKGKQDLFDINIIEEKESVKVQAKPGRPGPDTIYTEKENSFFRIEYSVNEQALSRAERTDGIFPLVTNGSMDAVDVLSKYKNQPYLEKRMYTAKSVLKVAPVFLESPHRIEAALFLYFTALTIVGLIERNIRKNMQKENIEKLPILPSRMRTKSPTWNNLNNFFRNVHISIIEQDGKTISTTLKGMTDMHYKIIRLLDVPASVYRNIKDQWWVFAPV